MKRSVVMSALLASPAFADAPGPMDPQPNCVVLFPDITTPGQRQPPGQIFNPERIDPRWPVFLPPLTVGGGHITPVVPVAPVPLPSFMVMFPHFAGFFIGIYLLYLLGKKRRRK